MMNRTSLHTAFAEAFHAGKRLRPATEAQLADAEAKLSVLLPEAYRQFALANGAIYCPAILDLVIDRKAAFADVQQFLTPRQSVTETGRWHLDPDGGCAAFASDSSGNFFAFRQLPASGTRPDDAAVWLFDHEAEEVVEQGETFDEWLNGFLRLRGS
jgi:hypothetical protein